MHARTHARALTHTYDTHTGAGDSLRWCQLNPKWGGWGGSREIFTHIVPACLSFGFHIPAAPVPSPTVVPAVPTPALPQQASLFFMQKGVPEVSPGPRSSPTPSAKLAGQNENSEQDLELEFPSRWAGPIR